MSLKLKLLKKVTGLMLAVLLFVNPLAVPIVCAEDEGVTPTPTPEAIVSPVPSDPSVTPDPSVLAEPTSTPVSTITTGDAEASSQTDVTVNSNKDTVDGSLDTPAGDCTVPEGQTTCPGDIDISNDNQAEVSDTTNSSADTGGNEESGSAGNATIDTGDATASGEMTNDINSNTVVATASPTLVPESTSDLNQTPTVSISPEGLGGSSPQDSQSQAPSIAPMQEIKDLKVTNENDGKLTNNADVTAETGNNVASENLGDVDLKTGDALAWVNLLNFLNTNIVGSNFELLVFDIGEDSNGEIDLNELWKQLQEQSSSGPLFLVGDGSLSNLRLIVSNNNSAGLENTVNVCAATGGNQANQNNSVGIETGEATALANIVNVVNANILGSKFFFGIVNITGQFTGNLILPRPERFLGIGSSAVGQAGVVFENQNFASVVDTLSSSADTGGNKANYNGGNNTVGTGDAEASTRDLSLVNLNLYKNDWFYLLMNILGNWDGRTYGWSSPDAVEGAAEQSQAYELGGQSSLLGESLAEDDPVPAVDFQNRNIANVKNDINVSASTGGNQANENVGSSSIKTGKAKAVLNLLNLINLNILASRWFMGLVNILGNWSGNTIFAYPDLTVSFSGGPDEVLPGDSFEYVLSFGNQGYDEAEEVSVKMELPEGLSYEGDTSGIQANCKSQNCTWSLGNLKRSQGGSFRVRVKLDPNFFSLGTLSFWERLVPKAYAAEDSSSLTVKAVVMTITPDSNEDNNVAVKTTEARMPSVEEANSAGSEQVDQRQPVLEITAKNNVNEFVYPRDIVTFEITVKNTGEVRSKNTYLTQALYNGVPEDFGVASINIGTIEPGKTAKISFGITLADGEEFYAGSYYSITKAIGFAPNGQEVSSSEARTDFKVKLREIATFFEAKAIEKKEEEILGVSAAKCPDPQEKILPYVLLFVLSSLWIVERSRKLSEKYFRK